MIEQEQNNLAPKLDDLRFAVGIYSISEVAMYVGLPRSTLQGWIHPNGVRPAIVTSLTCPGAELPIPFVGFVEAFVLQGARHAGLPRHAIRRGFEATAKAIELPHVLASSALTDPDTIELFVMGTRPTDGIRRDRTGQVARALREHLRAIDYAEDGYAERIRLRRYAPAGVVVDPAVAFGLPFIAGPGPRVEDVLDRFRAGDTPDSIALDFGLSGSAVDALIGAAGR